MAFDLSNEVFEELLLPNVLVEKSPINICTSVCKDSIAVLHYDRRGWSKSCSVWLMKECGDSKSWSKLHNVDLEGGFGAVLNFRKNGDTLLTESYGELVSYDPRTQAMKGIGTFGTKDSFFVDGYSESLTLLTEGERVLAGLPNVGESDSSEEDEGVEKNELWMQSIMIHYLTAMLRR